MPPDTTAARHAQLFELLRHENLSERTSARLRAREFARTYLDSEEASELRLLAVSSWN